MNRILKIRKLLDLQFFILTFHFKRTGIFVCPRLFFAAARAIILFVPISILKSLLVKNSLAEITFTTLIPFFLCFNAYISLKYSKIPLTRLGYIFAYLKTCKPSDENAYTHLIYLIQTNPEGVEYYSLEWAKHELQILRGEKS